MMKILYELNCESLSVLSQSVPTVAFTHTWCCKAINMNWVYSFCSSQKYEVSCMYAKLIVSYTVVLFTHVWKFHRAHERKIDIVFPLHNGMGTMLDQYYTCHKDNIIPVSHCNIFVSLKTSSPSGSVTNPYNVPLCKIFVFLSLI